MRATPVSGRLPASDCSPEPASTNDEATTELVEGETKVSQFDDYTSHNTQRLDIEQIKDVLIKLDIVREAVRA